MYSYSFHIKRGPMLVLGKKEACRNWSVQEPNFSCHCTDHLEKIILSLLQTEEGTSDHLLGYLWKYSWKCLRGAFPMLSDNKLQFHWTEGTTVSYLFHYL